MEFKEIKNIRDYVLDIYLNGAQIKCYAKFSRIKARDGYYEGEVVKTTMKNGLEETVNIVKLDSEINKLDKVVKNKSNEQYVIPTKKFLNKYSHYYDDIWIPKKVVQMFIKVDENISFIAPWGEKMNIEKGGYLNITDKNDIYGVQEKEFKETYAECDATGRFLDESLNDDKIDINDLQM